MLPSEDSFFKNGKVNREALVDFIKTIKKNTNLSDEDAAIMAASKVLSSLIFEIEMYYWNLITWCIIEKSADSYQVPVITASQVSFQSHNHHHCEMFYLNVM